MHLLSALLLACLVCVTFAQYDSPTPPRPIIPGSLPIGSAGSIGGPRPALRRRPIAQAPQELPPPPRRISSGRGGGVPIPSRRLPSPLLEQSLVSAPQRPSRPLFNEPILRAPQLPSPPPIPTASPSPLSASILPQFSPQPTPQISPRPVVEDLEDEEENIPSIQHLTHSQPQQIAFRPSPLDDLPVPTRQQYHRPSLQSTADDDTPPPAFVRQSRPHQEVRQQQQPQQEVISRQPARQQVQRQQTQAQQPSRQSVQQQQHTRQQQVVSRPANKELDKSTEPRGKKPEVQNIRKYRQDNEDGSITWGFENDDGTYKEETIGTDCVTRGKYGYYDPDGVRREFTYQSGLLCDPDKRESEQQETNEGYIDYSNNRYVLPNGDAIDLDNMVKNKARKPLYRN